MKKKKWEKPELVVIVRNQPEESVLQACKSGWYGIMGPNNTEQNWCLIYLTPDTCNAVSSS